MILKILAPKIDADCHDTGTWPDGIFAENRIDLPFAATAVVARRMSATTAMTGNWKICRSALPDRCRRALVTACERPERLTPAARDRALPPWL